ncbi:MAG TPA: TPM domain-containing protein, partial [Thermodesulfovibrionales bacterium]|nr:TPM domain-containing protein [Thermodesulfovibrionales bacterium]
MISIRKRKAALGSLWIAFCLFLFCTSSQALDVPPLKGYVNDYADMISATARAQLENELKAFEQTDSTQVVILTIPSLEGEVIEDYGIKVADAWKIGQKGKDNGVIFLVAKNDRKMRIEVGRGLEGKLTDLTAGRIVDLVVKPRFKRGDFDGGFVAGISAIIDATRGEFKADENRPAQRFGGHSGVLSLLIFGGLVMLVLGSISRAFGGIAGAVILPGIVHMIMPGIVAAVV